MLYITPGAGKVLLCYIPLSEYLQKCSVSQKEDLFKMPNDVLTGKLMERINGTPEAVRIRDSLTREQVEAGRNKEYLSYTAFIKTGAEIKLRGKARQAEYLVTYLTLSIYICPYRKYTYGKLGCAKCREEGRWWMN